jgi:hypothetical protein
MYSITRTATTARQVQVESSAVLRYAPMTTVKTVKIAAALAGAALIVQVAHAARAQQPAVSDGIALQRAAAIYNFRTTAQRGAQRGEEIWAAALHSGRSFRFNPRTERWIDYMLPEPYSHDRRTWIDNSTTPVTVWYVDHNGYVVRLQPLE